MSDKTNAPKPTRLQVSQNESAASPVGGQTFRWRWFTTGWFAGLYALIGTLEVLAERFAPALVYATKPLLLLTLSLYWWHTNPRPDRRAIWVQVALAFAWLGDVLLLFQEQHPLFFMLGLGSFLLMQLLYAAVFSADVSRPRGSTVSLMGVTVALVGLTVRYLWPHLPAGMTLPVAGYMLAITSMVLLALLRRGRVSSLSFGRVAGGAFLFLLSDSLLAFNRFVVSQELSEFLVMPTYIVAQYLIVTGLLAGRSGGH